MKKNNVELDKLYDEIHMQLTKAGITDDMLAPGFAAVDKLADYINRQKNPDLAANFLKARLAKRGNKVADILSSGVIDSFINH